MRKHKLGIISSNSLGTNEKQMVALTQISYPYGNFKGGGQREGTRKCKASTRHNHVKKDIAVGLCSLCYPVLF